MEFVKVDWFYLIKVNGEIVGTVDKLTSGPHKGKWVAYNTQEGWMYGANTRKQAAQNMIEKNR